jgi:hypothetical protein
LSDGSCCFLDALAAVGGDESDHGASSGDEREDELEKVQLRFGI